MRRTTSSSSVFDTTSPVAIPREVELALNGTICSREITNGIYDDGSNKTYTIQKAQKGANAIDHEVLDPQEHVLGYPVKDSPNQCSGDQFCSRPGEEG